MRGRGFAAVLMLLLALATTGVCAPRAALAGSGADGALVFRAGAAERGGGEKGGGIKQWADEYLNFFSGGAAGRTDQRRPSCGARVCPSGSQCCCCGDRCYCKEQCSFEPCDPGR